MKVALAQMNFLVGDVEGNTENILSALSQVEGKADLLVVSEMAVCGYPPRDLLEVPSFLEKVEQANERIARETSNFKTAILFGTVAREGEHLYNAAIVAERGKETSRHYKTLLPTYDVFDEHRYFQCAKSWSIARVAGKKIAVFICEDIWFEGLKIRYELDPAEILGAKDPDLFVAINSSPFYSNKTRTRM